MSDGLNKWVQQSIEIANTEEYLDNLQEIYSINESEKRELDSEIVSQAEDAFERRDDVQLIESFLSFDKFPYDDIYVGFLRYADEEVLKRNQVTVSRIAERIYNMGFDEAITRSRSPKVGNRQLGSMFEAWCSSLSFKTTQSIDEFSSGELDAGVVEIFDGSPNQMLKVMHTIGIDVSKEPDFLARKNIAGEEKIIIGEAKFLSSFGGHQDRQMEDVLSLVSLNSEYSDVNFIGIVDGVPWLSTVNRKLCRKVRCDEPIFSALLLVDYLAEL